MASAATSSSSAPVSAEEPIPAPALASEALDTLVRSVEGAQGELSVTVADTETGQVLLSRAGDVPRNPASVSKLLTARVALSTLGDSFRFTTTLRATMSDGTASRLVIRSDGNPALTLDDLRGMVWELKAQGLRRIGDGIFVDQSLFGDDFVPPAFEQQPNEWAAFRAPVCATAVDRNRVAIRVTPTKRGMAAKVVTSPPGLVEITGTVQTVERGRAQPGVGLDVRAVDERLTIEVSGNVEEHEPDTWVFRRLADPRKAIGRVLRELLREADIQVPTSVELWNPAERLPPIVVTRQSEPLPVLLRQLGKESDNFTAEMLLRAIGAKAKGVGSSQAGAEASLEFLTQLGPLEPGSKLVNGSGLFDANRLSTDALLRLLLDVRNNRRFAPEFLAQLSLAASDGTLKNRFEGLPADCVIRAKTGTLRAISALAGYVERPKLRPLAFAVIVDKISNQAAVRRALDAFVTSLCTATLAKP